jgi:DNA (cytosine-5)-methyltransferase 1
MSKGKKYQNAALAFEVAEVTSKAKIKKKSVPLVVSRPWDVFVKGFTVESNQSLTAVSLFAGCGGLDLGLHQAGFKILWANDIDKDACATYRTNLGDIIHEGNIRDTEFPSFETRVDLLSAGFPCQSFSNAGLRKGIEDDRGTLYESALKAVEFYHPRVVLFENVRGLLSVKVNDELLIKIIATKLQAMGYDVSFKLIGAHKHHVAQKRLRLLLIGVEKDAGLGMFRFPLESTSEIGLNLGEIIMDIPEGTVNQAELMQLNPQAIELGKMIPEGGSWKDIPYEKLPPRLQRIRDNMSLYRWPKFFRRFSRDEISGTITAAFKPENAGVWHPVKDRIFSVREIARIQSFPDWFAFEGKHVKAKYQQIGNAVPPRLAFEIGIQIKDFLNGKALEGLVPQLTLEEFIESHRPLRVGDSGVYLT